MIIGAQKSGTTALYDYLNLHPNIASAYQKETKYFDLYHQRSINWYKGFFPKQKSNTISGEATPDYFFDPEVPKRIKASFPNIKLILLLRDPVERAVSHYNFNKDRGIEALNFSEAIHAEQERVETQQNKEVHLKSGFISTFKREFSYVQRGKYIEQLDWWLRFFKMEQFHFCSSEDLKSNPENTVKQIYKFLGLSSFDIQNTLASNVSLSDEPIDKEIKSYLSDEFAPYNNRLFELIGQSFNWT